MNTSRRIHEASARCHWKWKGIEKPSEPDIDTATVGQQLEGTSPPLAKMVYKPTRNLKIITVYSESSNKPKVALQ